ncbi:C45 family autoproteolytic acyltransferase/hydolase [Klebsiella quasipneumoniae]|jgi:predicted choloylglycine hydrolase|uniref:C45 family autoproteolytic acyltransferase/hydolase n=1 Tax=Klebsiella quasipneumoniae TaxID=1463165 RepID=UPI000A2D7343|nr:C45 family peptidase [Klebsiella quasipneumoniae]MVY10984.1 acyl-CoA--6-aminopenicillanic acid acyl-transferase [Enterobacteriaceae bacterium 8376wH8]MBF7750753.1 acyl-CoA--6-aminopenicillanic acid acyl-transferase [Klebsiella quasipneumoniae]MBF7779614.1 acyl-CoA--6-aminopenicillanic acid acyl-transferase [Klebsiella quasipneumoniae]OSZ20629.1 acyl-CoA--6-aminopenicillanic acid acyl-transferase [Klebsiella quasipneumoniae]HCA6534298.1 acyl-CoA--6-aminopenicillanic acid acyl-transferase [Kl
MKTIAIRGSAYAVGQQLGAFGREAWHTKIRQTALWQTVTALKTAEQTQRMRAAVQAQFPLIWQELEGMAEGLQAPVDEVFAWNCRGDLVRSTSDGCTTLAGRSPEGALIIAHNEDGFPQLREECAIVSVTPEVGLAFTSFAYPGSLCGHTFAVNEKGIVNTVNNIRAVHRPDGMPRQIVARASLNAATLEEAVTLLSATPRAGAFHHTLGQMGDSRLFSVEATGSGSSVLELSTNGGHANHLIHPQLAAIEQIVTGSSASRQRRLDAWLATNPPLDGVTAKAMLSDQQDPLLPIYRLSPDDPDEENTLATAIFTLSATRVVWQIFTLDRENAVLQGSV